MLCFTDSQRISTLYVAEKTILFVDDQNDTLASFATAARPQSKASLASNY